MAASSPFRVKLGAAFPDFECDTGDEKFSFHEFLGRAPSWTVLLSFGSEFSPVSTSELGQLAVNMLPEFTAVGIKVVGVVGAKTDGEIKEWAKDAMAMHGGKPGEPLGFPMISDATGEIGAQLGFNPGCSASFVIGQNKTLRLGTMYPATVGRSMRELLRVVQSLFITQDFKLATPVNWKMGDRLIVTPAMTSDVAKETYSNFEIRDLPSGKPYLRYVDQPDMSGGFKQPEGIAPPVDGHQASESDFRIMLGADFPNFECSTTKGTFSFHDYCDEKTRYSKLSPVARGEWTVIFSHPKDFTPVCTTELGTTQALSQDLAKRGVKLIGLSCDTLESHGQWEQDVLKNSGLEGDGFDFPLISDEDRTIAALVGMIDPLDKKADGPPMPARTLFLLDSDKKIACAIIYPATTGRNFDEIMRVVDAVMFTRAQKVVTPAEWMPGDRVLVSLDEPAEEAKGRLGDLDLIPLPSGKEYLRFAACPVPTEAK